MTVLPATRERLLRWCRDTPLNLAVFRVTVAAVILAVQDVHRMAVAAAQLPLAIRTPPLGWRWAARALPLDAGDARTARVVLTVAAITGGLGLFSRVSFAVVAAVGLFFWGLAQGIGSAVHFHHLWWFAVLLAASPCGDALSVDALVARRRGTAWSTEPSLAHGVPLRAAWLLLGAVFFFPGLWKLITSGPGWVFSDNLRNQMYAKWTEMADFTPLARVDRVPGLLQMGALAVVLLELSFPALVVFRRTRPWAVGAAFAFHQATAALMGLRFASLWWCYTVFFDWTPVAARLGLEVGPSSGRRRSALAPAVVACLLLAGAVGFGAAGESDGWPFACYPKFDRVAGETLPALDVELVYDGRAERVPTAAMFPYGRTQRYWALTWSLLGAHRSERATGHRFGAFWREMERRPGVRAMLPGARAVRFYRATISTLPERRDGPPLRRRLLAELPLAARR